MSGGPRLTDRHPSPDDIAGDVLRGLSATPRRLPSKYFYDRRGSELFEAITRQPEYYLTRVELELLAGRGAQIAAAVGPRAHVVEPGSGSGRKTRLLLRPGGSVYTPIVSRDALVATRRLDSSSAIRCYPCGRPPVPLPACARGRVGAGVLPG